jgi:hypothetical protein
MVGDGWRWLEMVWDARGWIGWRKWVGWRGWTLEEMEGWGGHVDQVGYEQEYWKIPIRISGELTLLFPPLIR